MAQNWGFFRRQCATMDRRRTLTMNWDDVEDDDDDFFDPRDRFSSAVPQDLESSGSDDEFEDSRLSFSTTVSASARPSVSANVSGLDLAEAPVLATRSRSASEDYDLWMAEPGDVKERRRRLLQGMGLLSNKSLHKIASAKKFARVISRKAEVAVSVTKQSIVPKTELPPKQDSTHQHAPPPLPEPNSPSLPVVLVRSRSAGDMELLSVEASKRKEELMGPISKKQHRRALSGFATIKTDTTKLIPTVKTSPTNNGNRKRSTASSGMVAPSMLCDGDDSVNYQLMVKDNNDAQTGKEMSIDEFDRSGGFSPVVKEVMRRSNDSTGNYYDRNNKLNMNSYLSRSVRYSKRRGVAILKNLKNIKGVAHSMSVRITDLPAAVGEQKPNKNSSQWIKVRQHGKPYKEFTGLHLCQEINAHEGSIWSIKFSSDSHYLASAGEDRVIHIWEVQDCDVMAGRPYDDMSSVGGTPVHPMAAGSGSGSSPGSVCASPVHPMAASPVHPMVGGKSESPLGEEKRKKGMRSFSRKKGGGNSAPDFVIVPETVFALSEKPVCSLIGHQEAVLDLSWSRSQLLLSSSMDKTVRLWDVETQNCLKMFAHNDYVTCIQFNPVDDDYFISGSLDSKVRIWNITDRKVVDWTDQKEMVTATCYTPDGKGAMIGSHRGSCRFYSTTDCKLEQQDQFETQNKKKSQIKKVTGFQYSPWNPSELLISTADSRIRIHDGSGFTHKFKGFRNSSSQITASYSPDGKHVISASEDSQVFIWKREEPKNGGGKGGRRVIINNHEHFPCKDVSVAIPWPGSIKNEPPVVELHSKRHSKRFLPPQSPAVIGSPRRPLTGSPTRRLLPPLPKRKDTPEGGDHDTEFDPGMDDQFGSSSIRLDNNNGHSPSISSASISSSPSRSWSSLLDGGSNQVSTVQATAWGLVIVTASLGGEIRVYQNFGLPVKVSRQSNLFRDLA